MQRLPTLDDIRAERIRRAKGSFSDWCKLHDFHPAAHHKVLIDKLEAVERGDISRLMVFMPPGSAKSTYASLLFPPWFMGRRGVNSANRSNVITASYAQRLSRRFGKKCRNLTDSQVFRDVFGFGLADEARAADEWETEKGSEFTATSVDGSVTGRRGDLIVVDDPVKGRKEADSLVVRDTAWEWWRSDLRTRLKPGGSIIKIMTRWHEDDPAGRILPEGYDGESGIIVARDGEEWDVLSIRAEAEDDDILGRAVGEMLWPDWFRDGMLEQEKVSQGARNWNALYQQRPSPESGDFFRVDWFRSYDRAPALDTLRTYGASDYAVTADGGDYTVHVVVGIDPNDDMYLLDLWRGRTSSDVWIEAFCDLVTKWRPLGWAEETGQIKSGVGPFLDRRQRERRAYVTRETFPTRGDKAVRAQSIRGRMALGGLYVPVNASWWPALRSELLAFPAGVHDDQVDALGLAGQLLDRMVTGQASRNKQPVPRDRYSRSRSDDGEGSWKTV